MQQSYELLKLQNHAQASISIQNDKRASRIVTTDEVYDCIHYDYFFIFWRSFGICVVFSHPFPRLSSVCDLRNGKTS